MMNVGFGKYLQAVRIYCAAAAQVPIALRDA